MEKIKFIIVNNSVRTSQWKYCYHHYKY